MKKTAIRWIIKPFHRGKKFFSGWMQQWRIYHHIIVNVIGWKLLFSSDGMSFGAREMNYILGWFIHINNPLKYILWLRCYWPIINPDGTIANVVCKISILNSKKRIKNLMLNETRNYYFRVAPKKDALHEPEPNYNISKLEYLKNQHFTDCNWLLQFTAV